MIGLATFLAQLALSWEKYLHFQICDGKVQIKTLHCFTLELTFPSADVSLDTRGVLFGSFLCCI